MLQMGGIVSHDIVSSWEKTGLVAVAVLALVGAGVVAEVSGRTVAGDGAAGNPGHFWGVVRYVGEGGIADIVSGSH